MTCLRNQAKQDSSHNGILHYFLPLQTRLVVEVVVVEASLRDPFHLGVSEQEDHLQHHIGNLQENQ